MEKEQKIRKGFRPVEPWQTIGKPISHDQTGSFELGSNNTLMYQNPDLNIARGEPIKGTRKPGKNKQKIRRRK